MANRKGKTAEDVRSFAAAAGHDGPLEKAPPAIADRLGRRLEGMPDLFDANGEAISPASAPSDEPQADSPEGGRLILMSGGQLQVRRGAHGPRRQMQRAALV